MNIVHITTLFCLYVLGIGFTFSLLVWVERATGERQWTTAQLCALPLLWPLWVWLMPIIGYLAERE